MSLLQVQNAIGDFEIRGLISDRGGMGDVYEAYQLSVRRKVAAKALKACYRQDEDIRRRFEEEAIFLARLNHPNIVNVLSYDAEHLVIFMEFLEGLPLDQYLRSNGGSPQALPVHLALSIMDQILAALSHAHCQGLVHRDVKPGNIFVSPSGQVKLTDFGIAKIIGQENLDATRLGLGSPSYMAPEQILGDAVDGRSDIYASGIVLYQLLTGHMPFSGRTYEEIIVRQIQNPVPSPREIVADLPPLLCDTVLTATAKNPEERFQTADAFRTALAQTGEVLTTTGSARVSPSRSKVGVGLAIAALALSGVLYSVLGKPPAVSGTLQVVANEPAEIWIQGQLRGVAPASITGLEAGLIEVELVQPDFMTIRKMVQVEKDKTATIEAVFPAAGVIRVASQTPGTTVFVGGVNKGVTPLSLKLPVGKHSLTVGSVHREITIIEGSESYEAFE